MSEPKPLTRHSIFARPWCTFAFGCAIGLATCHVKKYQGEWMFKLQRSVKQEHAFSPGGVIATDAANGSIFDTAAAKLGKALNLYGPTSSKNVPDQGVWFTGPFQNPTYKPHYLAYATNHFIVIYANSSGEAESAVDAILKELAKPSKVRNGQLIEPFVVTDL